MKLLDIDWSQFFTSLELYRSLPLGARSMLAEAIPATQPVSFEVLGQARATLVESGFLITGAKGKTGKVAPPHQEFVRALRSFHRSRIFTAPSRESFGEYVNDHLSTDEIRWLSGDPNANYYAYNRSGLDRFFAYTASGEWLLDFLGARDAEWETSHQGRTGRRYLPETQILETAQLLVEALLQSKEPVALSAVAGLLPAASAGQVPAVVAAGLRYLLFFADLRDEDLEPVIGVWPGAARRLNTEAQEPPSPVMVKESFSSAFLLDDMTAILSQAAVEPLRLRTADGMIFEARRQEILAALGTLPEFVERPLQWDPPARFAQAMVFLDRYDFLEPRQENRSGFRLHVTGSGAAWLGLSAKDRLKAIFDGLLGEYKKVSRPYDDRTIIFVPGAEDFAFAGTLAKLSAAVTAAYRGVPAEAFVRLRDFLAYQTTAQNPLRSLLRGRGAGMSFQGRYYMDPSAEEIEKIWEALLWGFLRQRLLPLGGVKAGVETKDGRGEICFALTPAGRYLLSEVQDFEIGADAPGQIVVQPNFEVVFLAPSAKTESEIARFAERKGRHLGTLFRITKASIQAAAAAGFTRERVIQTLREHCTSGLPANVEREISGWFLQYREVTARQATLIHCPDEETATRVLGALGKKVTPLSATTLELHESKLSPTLLKKLREAGIFWRA